MALSQLEMVKQVQRNLTTRDDGDPGRHTWSCFLLATTPMSILDKLLPYAIKAFGEWLIIADPKKVKPLDPNGKSLSKLSYSVSGSFSWDKNPISIMIADGKVIRWHSCHSWAGNLPESVLCYYKDGTYDVRRVYYAGHLKRFNEIVWAVGGAGIMNNYNPKAEGFTRVEWDGGVYYFQDVWRDTDHIIMGFDVRGFLNIGFLTKCNYNEIKAWCVKTGVDPNNVILLDGGSVTAVNMPEIKYNRYLPQYYGLTLG